MFLIRDGIHYLRKGIYSCKKHIMQINKRENLNVLRLQSFGLVRQLALQLWSPSRKVFDCVIYNKICCS